MQFLSVNLLSKHCTVSNHFLKCRRTYVACLESLLVPAVVYDADIMTIERARFLRDRGDGIILSNHRFDQRKASLVPKDHEIRGFTYLKPLCRGPTVS